MPRAYANIAFTPAVKVFQEFAGSRRAYARQEGPAEDVMGPREREFIQEIDGFYIASVGQTGWPYVQFRGGSPGFLKVTDDRTLAFFDLAGNKQYITTGNVAACDKVFLFLMDYAAGRRLKIWGRARLASVQALLGEQPPARAERVMLIRVEAFDWNCSQHIPRRLTVENLPPQE